MSELETVFVEARLLSGEHINRVVRFGWRFPNSQVFASVLGTVREIHHDGNGGVYLHLIPADADSLGTACDKREFMVAASDPVEVVE